MATRNVNLINAISQHASRTARSQTSIVRIGWVSAAGSGGRVLVNVGGVDTYCNYLDSCVPAVGDQVAVLVTGSVWLVIGCIAV